jgi:quinoprotein glucose dehydrogenase
MRILHAAVVFVLLAAVTLAQQAVPPALVSIQEVAQGLPADGSRWLTFGGNYANHRYSPLTQITPDNVSRLQPCDVPDRDAG